jgi:hypothetical protein
MADLSITAASVVQGSGANVENGTAGATITAGQTVYKEAATGLFKLADNNSGTLEAQVTYGISLHASLNGQPLAVQKGGPITIGATLTAGTAYYQSTTAGGICPVADVVTTDRVVQLGLAISTTVLNLRITDTGVTL